MKKTLFTLVIGCLFAFQAMNAQTNLLQGSGMDAADQAAWTIPGWSSQDVATWGYAGAPAAGSGNSLRVTANQPDAQVQYAIYQQVTLESGKSYKFDAAVKIDGTVRQSWFEAYVGSVDPDTLKDYVAGEGIEKVASYFMWWGEDETPSTPDGTFVTGANQKPVVFVPQTSGTYYVLVKIGCSGTTGHFDALLDDVSFTEQAIPPVPAFTASPRSGFAPLTVAFTSTTINPDAYEWTFGDGTTSTEANPTHIYTVAGNYSVSLKVTNQYGDSTKTETNYITVQPPQSLTGGGKLQGGNMEDDTKWMKNNLSTPEGSEPVVTWNYNGENLPSAGQGGALRVQINNTDAAATVQYCIYQKVTLSADKVYRFNGAFRDNSVNLWHFWTEVYIAGEDNEPQSGSDFGASQGTMIAAISNWETESSPSRGLDGTYLLNGGVKDFIPEASGDYWFVFKTGIYGAFGADVVIDELLLEEVSPKPYTAFSSDNNIGFSPLTVQFKNQTRFATSYEWNFGDGSAVSTEEEPEHTYSNIGIYTVTLKASNAVGDSTVVKTDFVAVNPPEELPEGEMLYGGSMEKGSFWNRTHLTGNESAITLTWDYTDDSPTGGEGGNLRVQITPHSAMASANIAIWQPVSVRKNYVYDFSGLIKDIAAAADNFWVQVFVSPDRPETGVDGYADVGAMARFHSWTAGYTGKLYDGTFIDGAFVGSAFATAGGELCSYIHTGEDATMYFILKVGCNGNNVGNIDFLFDTFSLKERAYEAKPEAKFTLGTDISPSDVAPRRVEFMDASDNANKWIWNFGDGSEEQVIIRETKDDYGDTEHTYTANGWYTVSLTVYNVALSHTLTLTNVIKLGPEPNATPVVNGSKISVVSIDRKINVVSENALGRIEIYNINGQVMQTANEPTDRFVSIELPSGIYIVKADTEIRKVTVE
jgi:PKD repeat protein